MRPQATPPTALMRNSATACATWVVRRTPGPPASATGTAAAGATPCAAVAASPAVAAACAGCHDAAAGQVTAVVTVVKARAGTATGQQQTHTESVSGRVCASCQSGDTAVHARTTRTHSRHARTFATAGDTIGDGNGENGLLFVGRRFGVRDPTEAAAPSPPTPWQLLGSVHRGPVPAMPRGGTTGRLGDGGTPAPAPTESREVAPPRPAEAGVPCPKSVRAVVGPPERCCPRFRGVLGGDRGWRWLTHLTQRGHRRVEHNNGTNSHTNKRA